MIRWKKALILGVAMIAYTSFSFYFFQTFQANQFIAEDYWGMFLFLVLLILVSSFPIEIKGTNIIYLQAVTIAVFLQFGVLVEVILSQLTILCTLLRIGARQWERIVSNLTMFLLISVGSAGVFFALGGEVQALSGGSLEVPILPIIGYILTSVTINQILIYCIHKLNNRSHTLFGKDFWWELIPLFLITPTGILIYILYGQLQEKAIFYVMVPIVTFSIIFRLYSRLDIVNEKLKAINETGNTMTAQLNVEDVTREYLKAVSKLVPYHYCYLFKVDEKRNHLLPIKLLGEGVTEEHRRTFMSIGVAVGDGLSGRVASQMKSIRIGNKKDNVHFEQEPEFLWKQNSILSVPLVRNEHVIGVITLGHPEANKYSKEDATIVEILSNEAAIALKNADHYQETKRKSELDELTTLYNYRHFEHLLFKHVHASKANKQNFSLILLDIDHFKPINDKYGHLTGNYILQSLAKILVREIGDAGIVARYGGEEFTILLYNTNEQEAYIKAESVRQKVEEQVFEVELDLHEGNQRGKTEHIHITVSVGLAVYPVHADDPLSLIRHADRAMYIGAKRNGRNKVATYHAG